MLTVKKRTRKKKGKLNPFRVLGLDVSTSTGCVLLEASPEVQPLHLELVNTQDGGGIPRALVIANEVERLILEWHPDLITIEGYAYSNSNTLALLVEIGTLVRYKVMQQKVPYLDITPGSLKLFTSGKGTAKKELMRLDIYKRWGFEHPSNDILDAYALARIGLVFVGRDTIPKVNMRAVQTVVKAYPQLFSQLSKKAQAPSEY